VKNGRTQKCGRTELAARDETRRRCSRATKALRDRIVREWLFQRVLVVFGHGTARRVGTRGAELQRAEQASPSKKARADFA
jgi:hypothetical protein